MGGRILAATRKGLFTIERAASAASAASAAKAGAGSWVISRVDFLGVPVSMVLPDARDGTTYAALMHGHFGVKLHRSQDGGASWEECAVPAFPRAADASAPDASGARDGNGEGAPAAAASSLKQICAFEAGGKDEPGLLWAGAIPAGFFRSRDRGASWELIENLWKLPERREWFGGGYEHPSIHSICVHPRDSKRISLGVSCGGVWATPDAGTTWACRAAGMRAEYMPPERQRDPNIQDPHRLVQCAASPDHLWVQHHNGIFRSTDGGVSWSEITAARPSAFGFAVAVHPRDPDTAWFVPAAKDDCRVPSGGRVVVSRTRDGGRTFEVLSKGLPQEHAYDIVFRHALDIDASGERLAMGSTTGGLWISEDQGESWHALQARLPPVYCVRFGV